MKRQNQDFALIKLDIDIFLLRINFHLTWCVIFFFFFLSILKNIGSFWKGWGSSGLVKGITIATEVVVFELCNVSRYFILLNFILLNFNMVSFSSKLTLMLFIELVKLFHLIRNLYILYSLIFLQFEILESLDILFYCDIFPTVLWGVQLIESQIYWLREMHTDLFINLPLACSIQ